MVVASLQLARDREHSANLLGLQSTGGMLGKRL